MLFMRIVILGLLSHVSYSLSSEIDNNRIKIKAVLAADRTLVSSNDQSATQYQQVSSLLAALHISVAQNEPCFRIGSYESDDDRVRLDGRIAALGAVLEWQNINKAEIEQAIEQLKKDNETKELSGQFKKLEEYGSFLPFRFFVKENGEKFKAEGELLMELPVAANGKDFYFALYLKSEREPLSGLNVNDLKTRFPNLFPEIKAKQPIASTSVPFSPSPSVLKRLFVGSLLVGTLGTAAYSLYQKYFGTVQSDKITAKVTPSFFDTGYNALSATYNAIYNYFMGTNPEKLIKPEN